MSQSVPSRHPAQPQPVPGVVRALAYTLGVRGPDDEQFRQLGELLTVGDEPMDRLVEWMHEIGMRTARPLFEQALAQGIDALDAPPEPLRQFFAGIDATPDWVDHDKLARAALVMRGLGADGMYVARDVALLGGYQFAGFNQTLLRTGALEKGSNARFAETMQWGLDVASQDGLRHFGAGYRSTLRVRLIHAFVRRHVTGLPDWSSDRWGLPVNQTDMAATLVGALIVPVVGGLGMGRLLPRADLEAVAHLTRYTGWLIGVDERFLPTSFADAVRVLYHTTATLAAPDETTRRLAAPMVDDPLSWHYDRFPQVRRRIARSAHLSVTATVLGPRAMRRLGLSPLVLPWYPLLRLPINLTRSVAAYTLPGGMDRAAARGDRENAVFLRTLTDGHTTLGAAAEHLAKTA
ncbi:oxygenase MpaB family protein [Nocardia asteroides]|uniref:oxygenase MpaB family protein n=1 Tax=Nocardia asteroides TaxID=1824 RepID=UPI0034149E57